MSTTVRDKTLNDVHVLPKPATVLTVSPASGLVEPWARQNCPGVAAAKRVQERELDELFLHVRALAVAVAVSPVLISDGPVLSLSVYTAL